ncbi:MAG: hypothetical protein KDE27_02210 [Planctomycetes bacterium]|nr:hypothetical protein [Planctomycetota bacterium]
MIEGFSGCIGTWGRRFGRLQREKGTSTSPPGRRGNASIREIVGPAPIAERCAILFSVQRLVSVGLLLAGAAPTVPAQVIPVASAASVGVHAGPSHTVLPVGADVSTGVRVALQTAIGDASYDFSPAWDATAVGLVFDVESRAFQATAAASGGETLHELWSARPIVGRFVIEWSVAVTGTGAASFAFDLGDDGVVDVTASGIVNATLPAGRTPLRVRVDTAATAASVSGPWGTSITYQGTARAQLAIRFEPTHCAALPFAAACGGPTTTIAGNFTGGASVRAHCAPVDDLVIAVFGFGPQSIALPLSAGCRLRVDPVTSAWRVPGPTGDAEWPSSLPVGAPALTFATQVVGLDVDAPSLTAGAAFWVTLH